MLSCPKIHWIPEQSLYSDIENTYLPFGKQTHPISPPEVWEAIEGAEKENKNSTMRIEGNSFIWVSLLYDDLTGIIVARLILIKKTIKFISSSALPKSHINSLDLAGT